MVIEGINHNPALEILSRDHRNYRLTGSRFFRTNNPSADYDFFVQYDRELIAFLENNKFSRYSIPTYENGYSNFLDNLGTQDILGIWRRGNVDVQVSMNAYKRQIIQKLENSLCWAVHTMLVRYTEIVKQDPSFLPFAIERIEPLKDWGHLTEEINNALNELKSTQTGEQNIGCDNCGTYDRRQNSKYCHFCLTEWPHLEDE